MSIYFTSMNPCGKVKHNSTAVFSPLVCSGHASYTKPVAFSRDSLILIFVKED
jgi:hypothetical protein